MVFREGKDGFHTHVARGRMGLPGWIDRIITQRAEREMKCRFIKSWNPGLCEKMGDLPTNGAGRGHSPEVLDN